VPGPIPSEPRRIRAALDAARGAFRLQVDLDVPGTGVTALFGPSGSGKTTVLRALAGLERARGHVYVGDECWQDDARGLFLPTHRRGVGLVFQDAGLFPHLTVRGNLEYGRKRAGARARGSTFDAIVGLVDLGGLLERSTAHLSGGERQRVAIARALLAAPRLLLLDEPLASLDASRKDEILPYLERLRDDLAIPIVYVSHTLEEVVRLAGWLVLLERGRALASGATAETLARLDLPLASADDAGVVIEARVVEHEDADHLTKVDFDGGCLWVGRVQAAKDARVRVRVLARDVSVARDFPGPSSILNVVSGRVTELRDDGPDRVNVRVAVGPRTILLARITRRSRDALALHEGMQVHALVKSVALLA
jgi:molybdate transport system ATP-binding protein